MDIYAQMAQQIIKEQETILGPVAWEQALKVQGLRVDSTVGAVSFDGKDEKEIVNSLIKQYQGLFGRTSVEVCKEAVHSIITSVPKDQLPQMLL